MRTKNTTSAGGAAIIMRTENIKYNLFTKSATRETLSESYTEPFEFENEEQAKELVNNKAQEIVNYFNRTLRQGEERREFVKSEIIEFIKIPERLTSKLQLYADVECPYCFEYTEVNTSNDASVCDECLEIFNYEVDDDGTIETEML
ncbi:hypothetical protein V9L05_01475 [Bernardetia sp. Wsw4-3y2]|uniref:hypothetical protein n=1 Tax=Bernardetia sp. Wsw4-3y2 TaxID=3127471 RepID=UPI0030D564E5